jgi:tetratricopeptide (TPR) repeat protein
MSAAPSPAAKAAAAAPASAPASLPDLGIYKDPLHREPTPYEVLNVARGTGKAAIEKAVVGAIRRRIPPHQAQLARQTLLSPVERAAYDVLMYNPAVLERLSPNPVKDKQCLEPSRRLTTAEAWERQLRLNFPDPQVEHALGVLWYWWARFEQERGRTQEPPMAGKPDGSGALPLEQMWKRVFMYWSMLLATPDIWQGSLGLNEEDGNTVRDQFIRGLKDRLMDEAQRLAREHSHDHPLAAAYRRLSLDLKMEMSSAAAMAKSGYRTKRGRVTAGRMMLAHLELLSTVRKQVDGFAGSSPSNKDFRDLQRKLSPYYSIEFLLEFNEDDGGEGGGKPELALEQIDQLSSQEQSSPEICVLRAKALLILGEKQASVEETEQALELWSQALDVAATVGEDNGINAKIRQKIVETCQTHGHKLKSRDTARVIRLLEKGLALTKDPKLQLQLAESLVDRAFSAVEKSVEKYKSVTDEEIGVVLTALQQARTDIVRARELGSKRAADNFEAAEQILDDFKNNASHRLLEAANRIVESGDYDKAIVKLRQALNLLGETQETLRKGLANVLGIRGGDRAHTALAQIQTLHLGGNPELSVLVRRGADHRFGADNCGLCGRSFQSARMEDWFQIPTPGGSKARLCSNCMRALIAQVQAVAPQAVALFQSGESDLTEAMRLDPSVGYYREQQRMIRNELARILAVNTAVQPADSPVTPRPPAPPPPASPAARVLAPTPTPASAPTPAPVRLVTPPSRSEPAVGANPKPHPPSGGCVKPFLFLVGIGLVTLAIRGCS